VGELVHGDGDQEEERRDERDEPRDRDSPLWVPRREQAGAEIQRDQGEDDEEAPVRVELHPEESPEAETTSRRL
jgi:hypothetical protein